MEESSDNSYRGKSKRYTSIREGRRVIAKFREEYPIITPITATASIDHYARRYRDEPEAKKKVPTFGRVFREQLRVLDLEEPTTTFQAYC